MDYAFVPGSTPPERNLQTFFRRRPNTVLVDNPLFTRVKQFIDFLQNDSSVSRPLDKIFIVSHGNDGGFMSITYDFILLTLERGFEPHTTYEVLEYADTHNLTDLLPANIDADTQISIRGCKIGQAQPFVGKLKLCFGGTVPVSAPKFFDAVVDYTGVGVIESMGYDFSFPKLQAFRGRSSRTDLIAAFHAQNFKFVGGTPVPQTSWNQWLPRDVSPGERTINYRVNFSPALKNAEGKDITSLRLYSPGGFRANTQRFNYSKEYASVAPTDRAQQQAALRASLLAQPEFSTTHPFPRWKRYELDSFEAFISGFTWTFSRSKDKKTLIGTGTRIIYTLVIPITTNPLTDNNLILNISPEPGNTSPTTPQLLESNTDLFLTV